MMSASSIVTDGQVASFRRESDESDESARHVDRICLMSGRFAYGRSSTANPFPPPMRRAASGRCAVRSRLFE
jgi:hypothetical protein